MPFAFRLLRPGRAWVFSIAAGLAAAAPAQALEEESPLVDRSNWIAASTPARPAPRHVSPSPNAAWAHQEQLRQEQLRQEQLREAERTRQARQAQSQQDQQGRAERARQGRQDENAHLQEQQRQERAEILRTMQRREEQRRAQALHGAQVHESDRRQAVKAALFREEDHRQAVRADQRRQATQATAQRGQAEAHRRQVYLQSLRQNLHLRARRCPSGGHYVVGEQPRAPSPVVSCVNVNYAASCPNRTGGWTGQIRNYPSGPSGCASPAAAPVPSRPSCKPEQARIRVTSVQACTG